MPSSAEMRLGITSQVHNENREVGGIVRSLPLALELSLLAERTVYTLTQNRKPTKNDEVVLQKADDFLGGVLRGEEDVRTQRLNATSTRDIGFFRWGQRAYGILTERKQKSSVEDIRDVFSSFQSSIEMLREGKRETINESTLEELQEFFGIMLDITTNAGVQPVERVNLGYDRFKAGVKSYAS